MHSRYGKILKVDLSTQTYNILTLDEAVYSKYLGGKGLGSYLLYKHNPPKVDPLSAENCLIFATGPVCGTNVWGSCRYGVFTKSPLTGFYAESYSGGKVPEAIDATGFDAMVIQGKAPKPTVMIVQPEGVEFHDAADLWGPKPTRPRIPSSKRMPGLLLSKNAVLLLSVRQLRTWFVLQSSKMITGVRPAGQVLGQ
jgi:aldehyde:ferredoxin oxidoreductase